MSLEFIDFDAVNDALEPGKLVDALRQGFRQGCEMPPRHRHTWGRTNEPDAKFVLMPAWQTDGAMGVKLTSIVPGNSSRGLASVKPIYVLFDAVTGDATSILNGRAVTLNRTAAASALAATYLAREDASKLVMMGTGELAPYLVRAHCAVRPITHVEIWGRNPTKAAMTVKALADIQPQVKVVENLEQSIADADIVSCATLANDPILLGEWLSPGVHVDLVGSFTPTMREVNDEAIRRARLFADQRTACLSETGDLIQPLNAGVITEDDLLADLFALTREEHPGRESEGEITLFKSVGIALEDLVAAQLVLNEVA